MHTPTPRVRRVLLAGAALAAAALAAGCTSGSSGSSASAPAAATSAPATSAPATSAPAATTAPAATGSATGSSSPTSKPNAAGGAPACASADLHASLGVAQGAAGSSYQVIDFTNLGSSPCTLYGYPGVSLAGGTPVAQIGAAADRDPTSHATVVTVPAHGTANALLRVVDALNFPTSDCGPVRSTYLQVFPPNQTTPLFVSYKSTACSKSATKLLTIRAVQPGSGSAG